MDENNVVFRYPDDLVAVAETLDFLPEEDRLSAVKGTLATIVYS